MKNEDPFSRMDSVISEIDRINKKKYPGPEEPPDPHTEKLLAEAGEALDKLDPIVRETFRDEPDKLAEWDDIMQDWYKQKES
jgi:hypothetical protein